MLRDRGHGVPRARWANKPGLERAFTAALASDRSDKITELLINITKHILKPKVRKPSP
ncbi:hypothetical protein ACP70R_021573 [Stipagrostis hirtigluma subsp. patula]